VTFVVSYDNPNVTKLKTDSIHTVQTITMGYPEDDISSHPILRFPIVA